MKLLIATRNSGKLREYKELLGKYSFDLYSLKDFPSYVEPPEDQDTFEKNAAVKAQHAADQLNMLTLGDDSGLVVPALNGQPGVYSRRFAGENATDAENRAKLKSLLASLEEPERSAYFACAIALYQPGKCVKVAVGQCEGTLLLEERGSQGFGYDSLFIKHDYNNTFGELDQQIKNRVSHRRKALDKLDTVLSNLCQPISTCVIS
ncbi:MAG: RdgB/HAM1 family non-canonical purine NTP pyrophosphatase [Chlamydiia bacterium]